MHAALAIFWAVFQEGMNFEDTESFVQSVFDTHLLVAHLNFRDELYKHVDIRLKRLEDTARKMDVPGESRGVLKGRNRFV